VTGTWTTLVLGGARSGKSAYAEQLAGRSGSPVTYVATGPVPDGSDPEWAARVAAHRRRRPADWSTVEVGAGGDLAAAVAAAGPVALVDALGTWVAGRQLDVDPRPLCAALEARAANQQWTVLVSDEVGLGVHPVSEVGRRFADVLGGLNQAVAAIADRVVLVVAGRPLDLPGVEGR
jgi:adenosyl cobinamide kinase/adenosyl cobinamide phosphate guanylyltransferase